MLERYLYLEDLNDIDHCDNIRLKSTILFFMQKFKKSTANLEHSLKLPFPIDVEKMKREFEEKVKEKCPPSISKNKKREGWKRYLVYKHPDYLRVGKNVTFDFSQLDCLNKLITDELKGSILISAMYAIIPPKGFIGIHRDGLGSNSDLLKKTIEDSIRLHIPIYTNKEVSLYIGNQFQIMQEGEFWMLNNYSYHGVVNNHDNLSRNHLIIDVIPSLEFLDILKSIPTTKGIKNKETLKSLLKKSDEEKAKEFIKQLPLKEKLLLKLF